MGQRQQKTHSVTDVPGYLDTEWLDALLAAFARAEQLAKTPCDRTSRADALARLHQPAERDVIASHAQDALELHH